VVDAASGAVVRASRFDAFGNTVATAGTFQTPIGYRGQRFDAVLGQYDMRARTYDPTSGRFTAIDPAAGTYSDPLQLMRYGYAGANPVWRMDPSGRDFSLGETLSAISIGLAVSSINPHAAGTGQDIAFGIGFGISGFLGCEGIAAFRSIMGLPMGIVLGAAVGFYGGFIAGYADALADDPLVSEEKLLTTAIISGILGAIQGILAFTYLGGLWGRGACFAAGTPLLTPDGATPIEQLKPGDRVLARDESDPAGPVEAKVVEEVFVYESQVLYLTVGGRRIGTTSEHPFYVRGRGWTSAGDLIPGDVLVGHDGQDQAVQAKEAGKRETVYNMRVQDHHTYFVGCDEWGFSVWAHNACLVYRGLKAGDVGTIAAGQGISASLPNAGNSIESHVRGGMLLRSQWISTSKFEAIARADFGTFGVVEIDLDKVPELWVDCSAGIPGCTDATTNGYAIIAQEVVVRNHIPQVAIRQLP
jgi:RHS repeat-associated protein